MSRQCNKNMPSKLYNLTKKKLVKTKKEHAFLKRAPDV